MLVVLAMLFLLVGFGAPLEGSASSSPVQAVRVGWHGAYARVVFDLHGSIPYNIVSGEASERILVEFPGVATPPAKVLWKADDPLVREVRFRVTDAKIIGEILLNQPGVVQRHFRLQSPPRIAMDIVRSSLPVASTDASGGQPVTPPKAVTTSPSVNGQPVDQSHISATDNDSKQARAEAATPSTRPLEKAEATAPAPPVQPSPAQRVPAQQDVSGSQSVLVQQAESQWRQGNLDAAYQLYAALIERFPNYKHNHFIMVRMADILQRQERVREAIEAYAQVLVVHSASEGAIISRMRMAELGVRAPDALPATTEPQFEAYRQPVATLHSIMQSYATSPLADIARLKLGEIQLHRQQYSEALGTFRQLLQKSLQPDLYEDVRRKMATTLQTLLTLKQEEGAYTDVLQTFFNHQKHLSRDDSLRSTMLLPVAISYARLGLQSEAQQLFQRVLKNASSPGETIIAALEQANIFDQREQFQASFDLLEPLVPLAEPALQGRVLLAVGASGMRAGHPAKALAYLTTARDLVATPRDRARVLSLIADGHLAQNQRADAVRALQECAALAPVDGAARLSESEHCQFRAAGLLLGDSQYQQALVEYQKVLEHFPTSQYREQVLLATASLYHELGDTERLTETLTTLRDATTHALWKTAAADALTDHTWREHFRERFAALHMSLP